MKQRPPPPIRGQPLIHTLNMEQVHARQAPHRLALPELAQANRALRRAIHTSKKKKCTSSLKNMPCNKP